VTPVIFLALLFRSDSRPIAWCVIGIGVGIYLFYRGFRLLQRRQLILNTPISKIRSASMGMVELSGLAVGPYTMAAPVTGRACYYYQTLVWEWKQSGKNKQWVKVAAECMHVPFFLDDNTGKVMVDPRGAELDLHRDFQQEFCDSFFSTKEEVPAQVRGFLSRHGVSTANKIKVEEFCIKPKNALFVLGTLDENPGMEVTPEPIQDEDMASPSVASAISNSLGSVISRGLRFSSAPATDPMHLETAASQACPERSRRVQPSAARFPVAAAQAIRLSVSTGPTKVADMTQQQKISAALMKAGIASPAAWAAAGVTNSLAAANGNPDAPLADFDSHPAVVMKKGKNNPTFLISWQSQRELAASLGWKCALMIFGGPALTLVSLYGFLVLTRLV
jgi:hypothetical protein